MGYDALGQVTSGGYITSYQRILFTGFAISQLLGWARINSLAFLGRALSQAS